MSGQQESQFTWNEPKYSADEIVNLYVGFAKQVPGVLRIWARIIGNRVHFTSLIENRREVERALYETELRLIDLVGTEHVSFDVLRDDQGVEGASDESKLVLELA